MFAFLPRLLTICRKFKFIIFQGSVATCLGWGRYCHMTFVANFIRFPAVQKFWQSVKIWQRYREFKGGNFFETQCKSCLIVADWLLHYIMQNFNQFYFSPGISMTQRASFLAPHQDGPLHVTAVYRCVCKESSMLCVVICVFRGGQTVRSGELLRAK